MNKKLRLTGLIGINDSGLEVEVFKTPEFFLEQALKNQGRFNLDLSECPEARVKEVIYGDSIKGPCIRKTYSEYLQLGRLSEI